MVITKMQLPRRTVLRGLGVSMALPLLDSMVPALTALSKTAAAPVRRFGVFYIPNGMSMPYWSPKAEGPLTELPPTLRSLAGFEDRVLMCGGLDDEAANLVKGGGDHARSAGTFLTCIPFKITAGADVYARRLGGPDGGSRAVEGNAARLAGAGHRVERVARVVRRRSQLRLYQYRRVAHADHAAAHRERPARRVRAAVRYERSTTRGAAGAAAPRPDNPRPGWRRARRPGACARQWRPGEAGRVPGVGARHRAPHLHGEEQNTRELPVVDHRSACRTTTPSTPSS